MRRTHRCGELRAEHVGARVCLQGWVWRRRDMGGVIFVDVRDRAGAVQCVFNPRRASDCHAAAERWRPEFVVEVEGEVVPRTAENVNPALETGEVEVMVTSVRTLAESETPPFLIEDDPRATEEVRLRYRFLDLRRAPMQQNIMLRHRLAFETRKVLDDLGFLEIETPILTRSTPEGARDYLVPSRVHEGRFYALPQSPQLFKQLLMVSGYDRYFQIARCFRDEDLRADRQPEFTQIDVEMSFVEPHDVLDVVRRLMARLMASAGFDSNLELSEMTYGEAMDRFGTDRPDLRLEHEIQDVTEHFSGSSFRAFADVAASGGAVKALRVPGGATMGRSRLDKLTESARSEGAKGLVWILVKDGEPASPVSKFIGDAVIRTLVDATGTGDGDAVLLVGDTWTTACLAMGKLRTEIGAAEGWAGDGMRLVWITEFPLLEEVPGEDRLMAAHHPFTAVLPEDRELLTTDPLAVRARSYDLVLNGCELGSGSIRNHRSDDQEQVFAAMGISAEEARSRFGFLLEALNFGAPPHGGIALGFDRIAMLLAGETSIRSTIAFPKTTSALDLMTDAPSVVDREQLAALHIAITTPEVTEESGE